MQVHKELGLLPKPRRTASVCSALSLRRSARGSHGYDADGDGSLPRQPSVTGRRRGLRPGSGPSTPSKAQLAAPACGSPTSPAAAARDLQATRAALAAFNTGNGEHVAAQRGEGDSRRTTGDSAASGSSGMLHSPFAAMALTTAAPADEEMCADSVVERQGSWLSSFWGRRPSAGQSAAGQSADYLDRQPPAISIVATSAGIQVRKGVPDVQL